MSNEESNVPAAESAMLVVSTNINDTTSTSTNVKASSSVTATGTTTKTSPLPPPPTFDPSKFNNISKRRATASTSTASHGIASKSSLAASLPSPPPLPATNFGLGTGSASASGTSSSGNERQRLSSSDFPLPPSIPLSTTRDIIDTDVSTTLTSNSKDSSADIPSSNKVHEITEEIPKLESAPNSGAIFKEMNDNNNNDDDALLMMTSSSSVLGNDGNVNQLPPPMLCMDKDVAAVLLPSEIHKAASASTAAMESKSACTEEAAASTFSTQKLLHVLKDENEAKGAPLSSTGTNTGSTPHPLPKDATQVNKVEVVEDGSLPSIPRIPKRVITSLEKPQLSTLTPLSTTQSHIPIIILSTSRAKAMASKNNLNLAQMMTGLSNSLPTHAPNILGRMPILSSVNKSVLLNWDTLKVLFYEGDYQNQSKKDIADDSGRNTDAHSFRIAKKELDECVRGENCLEYACQIWDGDHDISQRHQQIMDQSSIENRISNLIKTSAPIIGKDDGATGHGPYPAERAFQRAANGIHDDEEKGADDAFDFVSSHQTPWLLRFRSALAEMTSHVPHDMTHCPSVVLLVASSSELADGISPTDRLTEMAQAKNLPNEFHNGLYDPKCLKKHFLILHDEIDGPPDFEESIALKEMNQRFGPGSCSVVNINSISPVEVMKKRPEEDVIWDAFVPAFYHVSSHLEIERESQRIRGCCLSANDKLSLRRFLSQMITLTLIPSIEKRIFDLNVAVTNGKKGVKNALKSFWRKPKESSNNALMSSMHGGSRHGHVEKGVGPKAREGEVVYRYDSIESQTRLLADTLFLVRDYETSAGMYRLVKDDYKHDHNLYHHASSHEMMALCLILTDPHSHRSKKEIIQHIETALFLYTSTGENDRLTSGAGRATVVPSATRNVTRLCLLLSSMRSLCNGRDMETADSLAAASSKETPLGAAVLLEQSSVHYFKARMYRKFGFHMLMAGHMYRSAKQEHHAIRCFASSMHIYNSGERKWGELYNHLTSALAGQLYAMKRMRLSLQLYTKLLGTTGGGSVSIRSQQKFIDNLIEICRRHKSDMMELGMNDVKGVETAQKVLPYNMGTRQVLEIKDMDLPQIFDSSLRVECSRSSFSSKSRSSFGKIAAGSDSKWSSLKISTEAELQVAADKLSGSVLTQALVRKIYEDTENSSSSRLKKLNYKNNTSMRALKEPITVSLMIANPLSVLVPVDGLQLVARLRCARTNRVYSNEDSSISKTVCNNKEFKFAGSDAVFREADFSRIIDGEILDTDEPFFVVNRTTRGLEPGAKLRISLELCPLVMGTLEIIGVRCKIFNEIWVYHKFSVIGELLQTTVKNRENRERGEASILKSQIDCDMPNVIVDIVPLNPSQNNSDPTVLQGQISEWILRISNHGTAPASNLTLKTNVPWINVISKISCEGKDSLKKRTSCCVGPSGTLMRIPLSSNDAHGEVQKSRSDVLHPGGIYDVPIQVRTSGGGNQEFYMLFRYELWNGDLDDVEQIQPKVRWLKKMVSIAVFPSLTVTASIMPSYAKKREHILSVEMANYRSDRDTKLSIDINNICIASKRHKLKLLPGQSSGNELSLGWQEQTTMHFSIKPEDNERALCTSQLSSASPSWPEGSKSTDFICLEHAHNQFMSDVEEYGTNMAILKHEKEHETHPRSIAQIRRDRGSDSNANIANNMLEHHETADNLHCETEMVHPTSLESLCSPIQGSSEINIMCAWKAYGNGSDEILGQHHLRQLVVRPQYQSKGCPLIVSAKYKALIRHDFSVSPLNVDMEINIRNRLLLSQVDFEFSLDRKPDFNFVGPESFKWSLNGDEELSFPLQAVLHSSGIYDLQCTKISLFQENGTKTQYMFPLQWIVKVNTEQ